MIFFDLLAEFSSLKKLFKNNFWHTAEESNKEENLNGLHCICKHLNLLYCEIKVFLLYPLGSLDCMS